MTAKHEMSPKDLEEKASFRLFFPKTRKQPLKNTQPA
jgi:hypothetical protein